MHTLKMMEQRRWERKQVKRKSENFIFKLWRKKLTGKQINFWTFFRTAFFRDSSFKQRFEWKIVLVRMQSNCFLYFYKKGLKGN
jgi:hypothetical protein